MLPIAWSSRSRSAVELESPAPIDLDPPPPLLGPAGEAALDAVEGLAEVHAGQPQRQLAALGLGDRQQVLGELGEPVGLLGGRGQRCPQLLRRAALRQRQLQLGAEDRQRRAQLVSWRRRRRRARAPSPRQGARASRSGSSRGGRPRRGSAAPAGAGPAPPPRSRPPASASPRPASAPRPRPRRRRARRAAARPARRSAAAAARSVSDSSRASVEVPTTTTRLPPFAANRDREQSRPVLESRQRAAVEEDRVRAGARRSSAGAEQDLSPTRQRRVGDRAIGVEHLGEALAAPDSSR